MPCASESVPGVEATSALVLTMQGASVPRTRRDGCGCCSVAATTAGGCAALLEPSLRTMRGAPISLWCNPGRDMGGWGRFDNEEGEQEGTAILSL